MASVTAITALSDVELLEQVRTGDEAAFTELFVRHRAVARRVALTYRCPGDPDDLVNEAFEKVFAALRRGSGPTDAFRAYLLVTMRRLAADHAERPQDENLDDVPEAVAAAAAGPPIDAEDRDLITRAFESLPDRWQAVLWYTAVEGRNPRELAPLLGVSANAVSALAYRAREQLRQAFLQAHLQTWARPQCEPHRSLLGAYVRDGQSRRERAATQRHLDTCTSCQGLVAELSEVNTMLVRAFAPLFPAALIAAKLAPAAAGAGGAGALLAAGEAGAHAARRGLGGLTWLKEAGATVGGVAAAASLLVGLAGLGAHIAGGDTEPDVAMRTEQDAPVTVPSTTTTTTTAAPPPEPTPAAVAQPPCTEPGGPVTDTVDGLTDTVDEALEGTGLGALDVDVPVLSALEQEAGQPEAAAPQAPPTCASTSSERGELTIGLGPTDDSAGGPTTSLAGLDLELLDLNVVVELGTGATAVDVDLPDLCEILPGGRSVTCALDSLTPANIGLLLDTAGPDAGATITVKQGDRTIETKTVDVLSDVGNLAGALLGGSGSPSP